MCQAGRQQRLPAGFVDGAEHDSQNQQWHELICRQMRRRKCRRAEGDLRIAAGTVTAGRDSVEQSYAGYNRHRLFYSIHILSQPI